MRCAILCFAVFGFALSAQAQTDRNLTLKPWTDPTFGETIDKVLYQSKGHVKGEADSGSHVFWWDSRGRFRFSTSDPNAFSLGYRYLTMDFNTNSDIIPDTLDDLSLAAGVHLGEVAGFETSVVLGAGYSGDNLFADDHGVYGIGHMMGERRLNETDSLVLSVDYDQSSAFLPDIPLPGFAFWQRFESLWYSIGFPQSTLEWDITPTLRLDAKYAVPYTVDVTLSQLLGYGWSAFGNYSNFYNAFFLDGERREDRLFYQMERVELGVRYERENIFHDLDLDAALVVGYAFDQQFSRGFDVRDTDPFAELSDEPYVGIILRGTF